MCLNIAFRFGDEKQNTSHRCTVYQLVSQINPLSLNLFTSFNVDWNQSKEYRQSYILNLIPTKKIVTLSDIRNTLSIFNHQNL